GCSPEGSDLSGYSAPVLCEGGSVEVTLSVTDLCENGSDTATFSISALPEIAITLPNVETTICNVGFPEELIASYTGCVPGTLNVGPTNVRESEDGCAELADYVFITPMDACGNYDTKTVTITREMDKIGHCETAFAKADEGSECFIPDFKRWGWTNRFDCEGTYELPLYAGAAHCNVMKGTEVGTVTVDYTGGQVTVTYGNLAPGYVMTEAHVYIGCNPYPMKNGEYTVAPGQYPFNPSNLGIVQNYSVQVTDVSGPIYVIAHAVTCQVVCMCSPDVSELLSDNEGGTSVFNETVDCPFDDSDEDGIADTCDPCPEDPTNACVLAKTTSTKEVSFTAYPVPFDQEVNIKYSFDYDTDVTIEVYDMKGALIRASENKQYIKGTVETTKLDLSRTDNQMFFVRVTTKEGTAIKKVVSSTPQ
uniref:T9SS type A sorting domain-containing protein n=1 Tax=Aestuariivivens insulae TaxID=1621988 RepID=UPI001F59B73B